MNHVTELILNSKKPDQLPTDALIVTLATGEDSAVLHGADSLPAEVTEALTDALKALSVSAASGTVTKIPAPSGLKASTVAFVGLGAAAEDLTDEKLRRAAGAAVRELGGVDSVAILLDGASPQSVQAAAEGALLGAYQFTRYKDAESPAPGRVNIVGTDAKNKDVKAAIAAAQVVATGVNGARDLVNAPPKDLYPETFADEARALVKGTKVGVEVLDEAALRKGGYGGLVGVGQGSTRGPRMVKLTYSPARAKSHYALVGKGITFDSGGLSIKPAKSMETMKMDMAGAAVVLHTVLAAAELKLPIAVTGYLALAENMPSGTAQRPSDVITIRGGKTVEVLNTDAEGRLVLADALVSATEDNADVIIDIATLTGAQMVALGNQVSAVMGIDEVREQVVAAADSSGEEFWPMPLPAELRPSLKSSVADMANTGDRFGGMLVAGLFLKEFVGETPWAHLDIAGPAFNEGGPRHYVHTGGTGVGVRTLVRLLQDASAK